MLKKQELALNPLIPGAGHGSMVTQSEKLAEILLDIILTPK